MSPTFQLGVGAVSIALDDSSRCSGLERCCRPCVDSWLVVDCTAVEKKGIHVDLPPGSQLCDLKLCSLLFNLVPTLCVCLAVLCHCSSFTSILSVPQYDRDDEMREPCAVGWDKLCTKPCVVVASCLMHESRAIASSLRPLAALAHIGTPAPSHPLPYPPSRPVS